MKLMCLAGPSGDIHLIPHGGGACVCLSLSMEARLIALEDRLRQTEEVLVAERLARQTAEASQQTVGPQPAVAGGGGGERLPSLVDTKAIGKTRRSVETLT